MKILVCDDVGGERTREKIEATTGHEAKLLSRKRLKEEIEHLFERASTILESKFPIPATENGESAFNSGFDLVVLDNNLWHLGIAGARHTAESIAGYVRAFGDVPYIVSLNKNRQVDFDLRHLVGDHQTQADLAVNTRHLSNLALWTGNPGDAADGFLPWYWPALNDVADRRRAQIRFVESRLDSRILESMAFPATASESLSRQAEGALSPETVSTYRVTFSKFFVAACRSLPIRADRKKLAEEARTNDRARDIVSRVVAGELDRWLRRSILAPQDVLVDLPHLLMRMPFLLGPGADNVDRWNEILLVKEPPYGLSTAIYETHLRDAGFSHGIWTESPCFWWRTLKSDAELNRMFFGDDSQWADVVFCEDLSRFTPSDNAVGSRPLEFPAEVEGMWNRRHVACLKRRHYSPKSRLAKVGGDRVE